MSEKVTKMKRITCDVCGKVEVIEVEGGLFSNPKTPKTWGYPLKGKDQLCPECKGLYDSGYENWYSQFRESRKGKGK